MPNQTLQTNKNSVSIKFLIGQQDLAGTSGLPDIPGLYIQNQAIIIDDVENFSLHSDFFEPPDGFSITVGDNRVNYLQKYILPGCPIQFYLSSRRILTGFLDSIEYRVGDSGGSIMHMSGRDVLGMMGDAVVPYSGTLDCGHLSPT